MFTSGECNKHRVLRDGPGHIFAFVPSSNGCKRLVAVAPQIGRRNSKRRFTSRECNKHRVLRDGSGHIFAFVPSSNGCKRLVAVAPQIGRRNSKRESSLWSGNWSVRWR